ncbi:MAG: hypothetical protein Q4A55_07585 [Aerococcus sp.]|nr:hypothetical protein [Aerococcus sp.]
MIEEVIRNKLVSEMGDIVFLEHPEITRPQFVVMERIGGAEHNHLSSCMMAFQSYGYTLYYAAQLNEYLKYCVRRLVELPEIAAVKLNSDYNFTNEETKEYRYQAVFEINYYDRFL